MNRGLNLLGMRYFINLYHIIIFLSFLGCTNQKSGMPEFKEKREIKGKIVNLDNVFLGNPKQLLFSDKYFIIVDNTESNFVKVINLNSKELVAEFGKKGRGPNEINYMGNAWINDFENSIEIFDINNKVINCLSLDSINKLDLKFAEKIAIKPPPKELGTIIYSRICRLSDSLFIASGLLENGRFALFNNSGEYLKAFDDFDFYGEEFSPFSNVEKGIALQGAFTGKQLYGKFAFATSKSACIQVYKTNGQDVEVVKKANYYIAPPKKISNTIATSSEIPLAFIDITSSEDHIFVLYSGKSIAQDNLNAENCNTILVYDWEGNPIEKIEIDISVSRISYNKESNEIIGLGALPEPRIISFAL